MDQARVKNMAEASIPVAPRAVATRLCFGWTVPAGGQDAMFRQKIAYFRSGEDNAASHEGAAAGASNADFSFSKARSVVLQTRLDNRAEVLHNRQSSLVRNRPGKPGRGENAKGTRRGISQPERLRQTGRVLVVGESKGEHEKELQRKLL